MLAATGEALNSLSAHFRLGETNGLTRAQLGEAMTHLAFYAGWPKATAAAKLLTELSASNEEPARSLRISPRGCGRLAGTILQLHRDRHGFGRIYRQRRCKACGRNRLGSSVARAAIGTAMPMVSLSSSPRAKAMCRQMAGRSKPVGIGDVVWTPPGVRHWHGASADQPMVQVAMAARAGGQGVQWFEPVSHAHYATAAKTD